MTLQLATADMGTVLDAMRIDLATEFELLDDDALDRAARAAVVETGGTLVEPPSDDRRGNPRRWGPHEAHLSLLGISHHGGTVAEAARQWTKSAFRVAREAEAQA